MYMTTFIFIFIGSLIITFVSGSFELAILRMSRYLDLSQNSVIYGDTMLPQEAFFTSDTAEMKLVSCVFEMAKSIAELKLTHTEMALYSATVLLSPGQYLLLNQFNQGKKDFNFCF